MSKVKYLGYLITDQLKDDQDMYRQRRSMYAQANSLLRKFAAYSDGVKVAWFRAHCTPLFGVLPARCSWLQVLAEELRELYHHDIDKHQIEDYTLSSCGSIGLVVSFEVNDYLVVWWICAYVLNFKSFVCIVLFVYVDDGVWNQVCV